MKKVLIFFLGIFAKIALCLNNSEIEQALEIITNKIVIESNFQAAAQELEKLEELLKSQGITKRINLKDYEAQIPGLEILLFSLIVDYKPTLKETDKIALNKLISFFVNQINPGYDYVSPTQKSTLYHQLAFINDIDLFHKVSANDRNKEERLNQKNINNETALLLALTHGYFDLAQAMIEAGARITHEEINYVSQKSIAQELEKYPTLKQKFVQAAQSTDEPQPAEPTLIQLAKNMEDAAKQISAPAIAEVARTLQEIHKRNFSKKELASVGDSWSKVIFYLSGIKPDDLTEKQKNLVQTILDNLFGFGGFKLITTNFGLNIIHIAVINNNSALLIYLLAQLRMRNMLDTALLQRDKTGQSPLSNAILHDKVNLVKIIWQFKPQPELLDELIRFAKNNNSTLSEQFFLEQKKLKPLTDAEREQEYKQLIKELSKDAIEKLSPDVLQEKINRILELNKQKEYSSYTPGRFAYPLISAFYSNNARYKGALNSLERLFDAVSIPLEYDEQGKTILHHAVQNGYEEMVKMIIEKGKKQSYMPYDNFTAALIGKVDSQGNTALHYAALLRDSKRSLAERLYSYLANAGEKVDIKNKAGLTPQDIYEGKGRIPDPVKPVGTPVQNLVDALDNLLVALAQLRSTL